MAAVPSIGRAARVEGGLAPEADLTRALYEQYANQIFRYCLHQLGSREEAEDAVQSTFLNAFRGIKRGVVPELESAWLFKIAHNVCLSRRRTTWRRGRIESPTDFDVVEELAPAPSRRADELIGLQDVLEQLPENQRRAILLREWQGLSYREIAEELELSQAAVETLIFRARRALASGLEQPPERKRHRVVRGTDLGNLLAGLKSLLLGGGAAVKVAATVAVVSASTVVVAAPVVQYRAQSHRPQRPAVQPVASSTPSTQAASQVGSSQAAGVAGPEAGFPGKRGAPDYARRLVHGFLAPGLAAAQVTGASAPDGSSADAPPAPAAPAADSTPASAPATGAQAEPQHVPAAPVAPAEKSTSSGEGATTIGSSTTNAPDVKTTDVKATDSKATDSQQPANGTSGGTTSTTQPVVAPATTQPVVAPPTTAPTPIVQTKTTTQTQTIQAPAVIPMAPSTAAHYGTQSSSSAPTVPSGSSPSTAKPVVTTPPVVPAPVVSAPPAVTTPLAPASTPVTRTPVVAPPTTTTQPAPVVSSPTIKLSSGSTSIGIPKDTSWKSGGNG